MNNKLYGSNLAPLLVVTVVVFGVIAYILFKLNHLDQTRVSIEVIPKESKVFINNKEINSKTTYLYPGKYTFSAELEGWSKYETTISINKGDNTEIKLLPEPDSDKAEKWLEDNPDVQQERESIGGENFISEGQEVVAENPLIKTLPYEDVYGPFKVDYGESYTVKNGLTIQVGSSTPPGREKFIEWLIQQGQDPTDLEIEYRDYINPFRESEQA